jgi:chromosome segregation ATPase
MSLNLQRAAAPSSDSIRSLILSKEKELHDINDYRIRTLETMLKDKEKGSNDTQQKFMKLKEDFQYNIKLIEDRDAELDRYDQAFVEFKSLIRDRDAEVSEMRVQVVDAQSALKQESAKAYEAEAYYKSKMKELRTQVDTAKWAHEDEVRALREQTDIIEREGARRLREKDEDLETQRREITATFDEVMRQREVETKRREDELSAQLRESAARREGASRDADKKGELAERLQTQVDESAAQARAAADALQKAEWRAADAQKVRHPCKL